MGQDKLLTVAQVDLDRPVPLQEDVRHLVDSGHGEGRWQHVLLVQGLHNQILKYNNCT